MDLGAVEGRRRVHARSEDVDVVPELAEALDQVGEADPHPGDVREGGRLCFVDFFLRGRAVRGRILPLRPSTLSLFSSENFSQQRPLCSLTDKDGDLPGRGGELGGGLDGRRGLGVEGDGLRSFFCLEKNKRA